MENPSVIQCKICDKTYNRKGNMYQHVRNVHGMEPNVSGKILCSVLKCGENFQNYSSLRSHLNSRHSITLEKKELVFETEFDFIQWKEETQKRDHSSYLLKCKSQLADGSVKNYYQCHRSGCSRSSSEPGCKMGRSCPSTIEAHEREGNIRVIFYKTHVGHVMDLNPSRLSEWERSTLAGTASSDLLKALQDDQIAVDSHIVSTKSSRDKKFVEKAFSVDEFDFNEEFSCLDQWVRQCLHSDDNPVRLYRPAGPSGNDLMLVLMTEFQAQILSANSQRVVCVDSLRINKACLTTVVVIDEYDVAFPAAFCVSSKAKKDVIVQFFATVAEHAGRLSTTYFMSSFVTDYHQSWQQVMRDSSTWIWSTWRVDKDIRRKWSRSKDNREESFFRAMKTISNASDRDVFQSLLTNYLAFLNSNPLNVGLAQYVSKKYAPCPERWAHCYLVDMKKDSIVQIEVMWRVLAHCVTVGSKKPLVKFVLVIMKLLRYKMLTRLCNPSDPEKIRLAVEAVNFNHSPSLQIPSRNITSVKENLWAVQANDDPFQAYVTKDFDSCPEHCKLECSECDACVHMLSCSCMESLIHANMCRHIHAVAWRFLPRRFSPPPSPVNADPSDEENDGVALKDIVRRMKEVYKMMEANKDDLSEEALSALMHHQNECIKICSGETSNDADSAVENISSADQNQVVCPKTNSVMNSFVPIAPKPLDQPGKTIFSQKNKGSEVSTLPPQLNPSIESVSGHVSSNNQFAVLVPVTPLNHPPTFAASLVNSNSPSVDATPSPRMNYNQVLTTAVQVLASQSRVSTTSPNLQTVSTQTEPVNELMAVSSAEQTQKILIKRPRSLRTSSRTKTEPVNELMAESAEEQTQKILINRPRSLRKNSRTKTEPVNELMAVSSAEQTQKILINRPRSIRKNSRTKTEPVNKVMAVFSAEQTQKIKFKKSRRLRTYSRMPKKKLPVTAKTSDDSLQAHSSGFSAIPSLPCDQSSYSIVIKSSCEAEGSTTSSSTSSPHIDYLKKNADPLSFTPCNKKIKTEVDYP